MKSRICLLAILIASIRGEPRYALSVLYPNNSTVSGVIAFQQESESSLVHLVATVRGLEPLTRHGIHIHAYGDLTDGCASNGAHYNPFNKTHGSLISENRHVGDLTNIMSDSNGNVHMNLQTGQFSLFGVYSVVGRAVVIHAKPDDLGLGGNEQSLKTGNAGARLTCGIIGLTDSFKNIKP